MQRWVRCRSCFPLSFLSFRGKELIVIYDHGRTVARMGPNVLNKTIGIIAPELRHYIAYVKAVQFFAGAAGWALGSSFSL